MPPRIGPSTKFSPWTRLASSAVALPAGAIITALSRRAGRIDLIGVDMNGGIWLAPFDDSAQGTGWGQWISHGQLAPMEIQADPSAPPQAPNLTPGVVVPFAPLGVGAIPRSPDAVDLLML